MTETKPLNIVVAGAGMGGLTSALALSRLGHRVELIERARELRSIGAAISIWPNGVKVLRSLGLGAQIDAVSGDMRTMSYRDRDARLLTSFDLTPLYGSVGEVARPIARAALQRILLDAVGTLNVRLGLACSSYEEKNERLTVRMSDGTRWKADLLIAADGTHSLLRDHVVGNKIERNYCGYVNWNGRIASKDLPIDPHEWIQFVGDGKRVSLMPMGNGETYFFFDVPLTAGSDNDPVQYRSELRAYFADWPGLVSLLIDRLDPTLIARTEIHDITPLEQLVNGRVALLGDAAHAMAPDLGQGGCQAIEDAWVLASCIEENSNRCSVNVEQALKDYQEARIARVASIVERARRRSDITHAVDLSSTNQWYGELARETGETIIAGIRKTIAGGPLG